MYLQQLSNVQGEEDNGGSDQGEEHEEVGELGDDDDGDVLECIYQGWTPRPAPPRGKTGCPAPQKTGFAPPRPAPPRKIDEIRGAQRGKTDCRFH